MRRDTMPIRLRSPRESLGGYMLLPRLIDKVRLSAQGRLPQAYAANLLGGSHTLDGRLLAFTGLDAEALRQAIMSCRTDEEVLAWVQDHARPVTNEEKQEWAQQIRSYRPDETVLEYRRRMYPEVAAHVDVSAVSVLDLIDMDEGRLPMASTRRPVADPPRITPR